MRRQLGLDRLRRDHRRHGLLLGNNTSGQLGNDTENDSDVPVQVIGLSGAVQISVGGGAGTGQASACALLSDGAIECWGSNAYGQLGNGTNTSSLTPVTVIDLTVLPVRADVLARPRPRRAGIVRSTMPAAPGRLASGCVLSLLLALSSPLPCPRRPPLAGAAAPSHAHGCALGGAPA